MANKHKILISIFMALALAAAASAQVNPISSGIILDATPEKPGPGDDVRINARSFAFDTSRAVFSWRVEGELVESGRGITSITATAGPVGSVLNISMSATAQNGEVFSQSADLPITAIDLIVNPLTYIPYFYRGAALPTPGGRVEIIAMPFLYFQGSRLNPATLFYEWSLGGQKMKNQSGEGKNKLTLNLQEAVSSYEIGVEISSRSGAIKSKKSIRISVYEPEILFYLIDSLTGPEPHPSNSFSINPDSVLNISAEPYYFDLASLADAAIEWLTGGEVIETEEPLVLDLNIGEEAAGLYDFSFRAEKARSTYQRAEENLSVEVTAEYDGIF